MTVFTRYDDLPEAARASLLELEMFIGDMDGKTLCIPTDGDTVIDDGTVDADKAILAFNALITAIRSEASEAIEALNEWKQACTNDFIKQTPESARSLTEANNKLMRAAWRLPAAAPAEAKRTKSMTATVSEPLPCPFCGEDAESDYYRGFIAMPSGRTESMCAIYCVKCPADMSACHSDHAEQSPEEIMEWLAAAWNARAAIRSEARAAGSAEGWQLVPKEPTEGMLTAAEDVKHECLQWSLEPGEGLDGVDFEPAYKAMLAAAPRPAPDETGER